MAELKTQKKVRRWRVQHRGRDSQVLIYLGKQFRFFINESDWKVLPMAAVIAALVALVIRNKFFISMEGSIMGAFALTCVGIWNGCFNSIQAVCRERPIVKREHRSGMHISSYVGAHMIYQLLLCAAQTGLTMYVLKMMGIRFPAEGFMTPWMIVDIGITMLLITYASDMMSLVISSISHTTTGAMTVMPFVLIFQLVFSGGIIPLPGWSQTVSSFTISNYGIRAIAAQSGYNELPMETAWKTLVSMRDKEIGGTFTVGQLLDLMDSDAMQKRRDEVVLDSYTWGEAAEIVSAAADGLHISEQAVVPSVTAEDLLSVVLAGDAFQSIRDGEVPSDEAGNALTVGDTIRKLLDAEKEKGQADQTPTAQITVGDAVHALHLDELVEAKKDVQLNEPVTLGAAIDFLKNNEWIQSKRDEAFTVKLTMGDVFDLVGEENLKTMVQEKTAEATRKTEYERTRSNIIGNWVMLGLFIVVFAAVSVICLELIDKDKR